MLSHKKLLVLARMVDNLGTTPLSGMVKLLGMLSNGQLLHLSSTSGISVFSIHYSFMCAL